MKQRSTQSILQKNWARIQKHRQTAPRWQTKTQSRLPNVRQRDDNHFDDVSLRRIRQFQHYICIHLKKDSLSYSRFIQLEHRLFIPMMFFLNTVCFGRCTGITFVDSTKIAACHNKRIYRNKVFQEVAKIGKSSMGWFYGFKLHFVCNDRGAILSFCLTPGNIDDPDPQTLKTLTGKLFGQLFADKGYISASLFEMLFNG